MHNLTFYHLELLFVLYLKCNFVKILINPHLYPFIPLRKNRNILIALMSIICLKKYPVRYFRCFIILKFFYYMLIIFSLASIHANFTSLPSFHISRVTSTKLLGVIISDDLAWGPHITMIHGKASQSLFPT